MTPTLERPALASLTRMEHEYSFKAELDPGWAVRPLALASHEERTMLVLTNPGGEPLDRLLEKTDGVKTILAHGRRPVSCARPDAWERPCPQGSQAGQYPGEPHEQRSTARRVWHRLTPAARAAGTGIDKVFSRFIVPKIVPKMETGLI